MYVHNQTDEIHLSNHFSFEHESIICDKECGKTLSCGHKCVEPCSDDCICLPCAKSKEKTGTRNIAPIEGARATRSKPRTDSNLDHGANSDTDSDILLREASAKGKNRLSHLFTESKSLTSSSLSAEATITRQNPNLLRNRSRNGDKALSERRPSTKKTFKRHNEHPSSSSSSAATSSVAGDEGQHHLVDSKPTNSSAAAATGTTLPTTAPPSSSPPSSSPQPKEEQQQRQLPILGDLIDLSDIDLPSSTQRVTDTSFTDNKDKSDILNIL